MEYTIKFSATGLQKTLDAIGKEPHNEVRALIDNIAQQISVQKQKAEVEETVEKNEEDTQDSKEKEGG